MKHIQRLGTTPRRLLLALLALLLVLAALLAANLLSLRLHGNQHTFLVGFRADRLFLDGVYARETDAQGTPYRWTRAESAIVVENFAAVSRPMLTLQLGGLPPDVPSTRPVQLRVDGAPWLTLPVEKAPRRYRLLLPPGALHDGDLRLEMTSPTSRVPPDRRDVAVRLDGVALAWAAESWARPTWGALLAQAGIVAAALAAAWRLALSPRSMLLLAGGLVLLLAGITGYDPAVAATWQYNLLVASLPALLLVWAGFPRLLRLLPGSERHPERARAELRLLLLLTLGVLGIRLLAALYPTFDSHDWYIHEDRLFAFQHGSLLLFDKPAEFSTKIAIVPPAFYVLVAPLSLLTPNSVPTTQGLYAFLDGCAALVLALFVRQVGGSARAARLALLLLAFLPIQFTALWWGFGPQVVGQALFLLLVLFVAQYRLAGPVWWVVATVLVAALILVHNGVALLGGFWLAGYVVLVWLFARHERAHWLGWGAVAAASAVVALLLLYIDVVALQLRGVAGNERLAFTAEDIFRVKYTLGSLCASFQPLALACDQYLYFPERLAPATVPPQVGVTLLSMALPLAALAFVVLRARGLHRWLVLAWLASAALFFAVDLRTGLQVRYAYFVAPLVCAGGGLLLDRLAARHRGGWALAAALVALVVLAGLGLWYTGVELAIKPSLRPLTH
jgi:hypothetical protein